MVAMCFKPSMKDRAANSLLDNWTPLSDWIYAVVLSKIVYN